MAELKVDRAVRMLRRNSYPARLSSETATCHEPDAHTLVRVLGIEQRGAAREREGWSVIIGDRTGATRTVAVTSDPPVADTDGDVVASQPLVRRGRDEGVSFA